MARRRPKGDYSYVQLLPGTADDPLTRSIRKRLAGAKLGAKNPRSGAGRARKAVLDNLILIFNP
jgi:hypothetical protein